MLGDVAELAILLKLKDEVTGPLNRIDRQLAGFNSRTASVSGGMSKIGAGLALGVERAAVAGVAIGTALTGIGVSATKAAMDFQGAMELIKTQAGARQEEVDSMSKSVLAMAAAVGTAPDVLAAGLYHIESAGKRGAEALEILRVAAEGARIGHADLESVTNALIAATYSGIKGTNSFSESMGTLNAVVGVGNMRMADLAGAFTTGILSAAKTFGISIQDVGAALATMTDQGVPAEEAATRLRMTFSLMAAPTSKAADEFKSIGLGALDVANAMRGPGGLLAGLTLLHDHMQKAGLLDKNGNPNAEGADLISKAFGGGRSSSAIMLLLGSLDKMSGKLADINKGAGSFEDQWNSTSATVEQKAAAVGAAFEALKIQLGQELLPVAGNVLQGISSILASPAVTKGIQDFGRALASLFSPANVGQAVRFAQDVIPQVESFARDVIPPLRSGLQLTATVAKQAFDLFNSLPAELKTVAIAALVGNKLTGGLVASGVGDIAKVLLGGGARAVTGASGGLLGGFGVQHVWVDNMPLGGMGGGPAGIPGGAGAAAGGLLAPGLGLLGLEVGAIIAGYALPVILSGNNPEAKPLQTKAGVLPATGTTSPDFFTGLMPGFNRMAAQAGAKPVDVKVDPSQMSHAADMAMVAATLTSKATQTAVGDLKKQQQTDANTVNHNANLARDEIKKQIAGQLDSKRAIVAAQNLVAVYTSGVAKDTTWVKENTSKLQQLQQIYMARGDTVTARKIQTAIDILNATTAEGLAAVRRSIANQSFTINLHDALGGWHSVGTTRGGNVAMQHGGFLPWGVPATVGEAGRELLDWTPHGIQVTPVHEAPKGAVQLIVNAGVTPYAFQRTTNIVTPYGVVTPTR